MGRVKDWTDQNVDKPSWVRKSEKQREKREQREAERKAKSRDRRKNGIMP